MNSLLIYFAFNFQLKKELEKYYKIIIIYSHFGLLIYNRVNFADYLFNMLNTSLNKV